MNHFIRIVIPFAAHENIVEEHAHNQKDIYELEEKTDSRNVVEDVVETSATLSKKLSVTPRTIQRDLDTLQRLGVIYRVGSDKDGHWEVNAKQRKNE